MASPETGFVFRASPGDRPGGFPVRMVVRGELDGAAASHFLKEFWEAVPRGAAKAAARGVDGPPSPPSGVMLDLSQLSFIDSTGLRALISIEQESERRKLSLLVIDAPEPVTRLLRTVGMADRVSLVGEEQGPRREVDFLERVELDLPMQDDAPALARSAVREALARLVEKDVLPGVLLMTSELVTNAVPDPGEGGRGLFVIDRCAARWGSRRTDTDRGRRFSVWFEVHTA